MAQATGKVVHNTEQNQFEMQVPGGTAVLAYIPTGDGMDFVHTSVPKEDEGSGHGTALVRAAVAYARGENKRVVATCPFVKAYFEKHPDERDLTLDP